MKRKHSFSALACLAFATTPMAHAVDLTWDAGNTGNGATIDPANGTWNTTLGNTVWNNAGTNVEWTAANVAVFGGVDGAYSVTVGASFSAEKIRFENTGYTLSSGTAREITITAPNTGLYVASGKTATIGTNVAVNGNSTYHIGAATGSGAGGTLNIEGTGATVRTQSSSNSLQMQGIGTIINVKTGGFLGTNTGSGSGSVRVGVGTGADVNLNVDGGTASVQGTNGTGEFAVGAEGKGTVTLTAGAITVHANKTAGVTFGSGAGNTATNTFNLDGGILTTRLVRKGAATSTAIFNFNGGTLTANVASTTFMAGLDQANVKSGGAKINSNGFNITIGQALLDGGGLTDGGLTKSGAGILTLSSGGNTFKGLTTVSAGTLALTHNLALQNSALNTTSGAVTLGAGITTPTFGGLSGATGDLSSLFTSGYSSVTALTLNPNSGSVSYGGAIANGATGMTLNKTGNGTQVFTGSNTYTGATAVSAGTLAIGSTGSLANTAITVSNAGSTFAVNAGSGTVYLGDTSAGTAGATLNLGSGTTFSMLDGATGTANLQQQASFASSGLTLSDGASLSFEVSSATADKLAVTKGAAASGTNLINVAGVTSMAGGPYDLITAASGLNTANFVFGGSGTTTQTVAVGTSAYALTLGNSATAVTVTVGAATSIASGVTWTGQVNGNGSNNSNWDNAVSNNWAANSTASAVSNGTAVTFNDTNAVAGAVITNSTVTVAAGGVLPTSTTFDNTAAVTYTVGGGSIGGTGGLTKNNNGTVILSGSNTYTGATNITAGKLVVNNTIGSSAVTVSGVGAILASDTAATIGNTLAVNNGAILAVGDAANAATATATVTGATTFNNGSIFSWDINAAGTSYDKLVTTAIAGQADPAGDAVFRIVVADTGFANSFWTSNRTWANIFTTNGSAAISNWATIFGNSVTVVDSSFTSITPTAGAFSITGNTLTWTAVPEPTSALAGLLITAGLLRRRRREIGF